MITLYQMPISHYCEKVRWMLSYKRLPYKAKNLLPGLHIRKIKKITQKTTMPVLVDDKKAITNSSDIISYLDKEYPRFPLSFDSSLGSNKEPAHEVNDEMIRLQQEVLEWETLADEHIGLHVRKICYNTLLDYPEIVIPFFAHEGPWYSRFLLKRMFSKLQFKMRKYMDINTESTQNSHKELCIIRDKIAQRVKSHDYLVGDCFTRADLSVAALFAPFFSPSKYGLDWPEKYPQPLQSIINEYESIRPWVLKMYERHR